LPVILIQRQRLATAAFAASALMVTAALALGLLMQLSPGERVIYLATAALLVALFLVFQTLTVLLTEEKLLVGFALFRSEVLLRDIVKVTRIELSPWRCGGYGLRWLPRRGWCYLARGGAGLRIEARRRRRPLSFSAEDPDAIVAALERLAAPAPRGGDR
jgi:hypothetical protein